MGFAKRMSMLSLREQAEEWGFMQYARHSGAPIKSQLIDLTNSKLGGVRKIINTPKSYLVLIQNGHFHKVFWKKAEAH